MSQASHHHQELPRESFAHSLRASAEPSGAGIRHRGRLGTGFPASAAARKGRPRTEGSARKTISTTPPPTSGARGGRRARGCAGRPVRGEREPRGRAGEARRRKRCPGPHGAPTPRRALQEREGAGSCPDPASPGLGLHASRALQQPSRAGPGRAARSAPRPAGDVALLLPLAPGDPPETPEESCAARGPERRPPRAPLRLPLLAAASSSRASSPQLRPRLRSPLPAPSPQGARARGALRAEPSARPPRLGCRWAPRHGMRRCSLGRRYCELGGRAGGCGVWAKREEGGTRPALRLGGGRRKPQRHQSPGRREWGGGNGDPRIHAGPRPPASAFFLPASSRGAPGSALRSAFPSAGAPRTLPLHAPLPCQASLAPSPFSFQGTHTLRVRL